MKNMIPLMASSRLEELDSPLRLGINPYANAGITAEKAPVLLSVASAGTVDADAFAVRMRTLGGRGTRPQARLALNGIAAVFRELVEKYGAITVNTPFGTVQTFIAGTVDDPHAAPDPAKNFPFLGVVVPEEFRDQFAAFEAYIPADACPASLKRVRDEATEAKGIRGTDPFYLEGLNMTFGGEGETLELLDATTRDKLCDVSVDAESKSPVQFLCTLAPQTALAAGPYLLRLMTRAGGEPGAALWPVELKVELLEAVPAPEPGPIAETSDGTVKVMSLEDGGQSDEFTFGHDWIARGEGFSMEASPERWWISSLEVKNGETVLADMVPAVAEGGTKLTVSPTEASEPPAGTYPDAALLIHLMRDGATETLTLPIRFVVNA